MGQECFKYSIDEFWKNLLHDVNTFRANMHKLHANPKTRREWMQAFLAWMEWETDMMEEYWEERNGIE